MTPAVFFATVLLERNRWSAESRTPTLEVSAWLPRLVAARCAGIELWENHWRLAGREERQRLVAATKPPVRIFNTYLVPTRASEAELEELATTLRALPEVRGLKFNFGPPGESLDDGIAAALRWAAVLPSRVRLLCECHPGTALESPRAAGAAFQRLPAARFGAILHPFWNSDAAFEEWLARLGERIEHLHLQLVENGVHLPFAARADLVRARLARLAATGFRGTSALEFVAGTNVPHETPEALWEQSLADLAVLREAWTAAPRAR